MTAKKELKKIKISRLQQLRSALDKVREQHPFATTDEWLEFADIAGGFNDDELLEDYRTNGLKKMKTALLHQAFGTMKDGSGHRLFHSVNVTNPDTGEPERVQYQESLFDLECYQKLTPRVIYEGKTFFGKAKGLNDNCKRKFGVDVVAEQFKFDFDAVCDELGLNETGKSNAA